MYIYTRIYAEQKHSSTQTSLRRLPEGIPLGVHCVGLDIRAVGRGKLHHVSAAVFAGGTRNVFTSFGCGILGLVTVCVDIALAVNTHGTDRGGDAADCVRAAGVSLDLHSVPFTQS